MNERTPASTYGDYEVDGPPVMLEPGVEYRIELSPQMGEGTLRHPDGRLVARLLHRDYAAAIRRGADTIRATEDATILASLQQSPTGRSIRDWTDPQLTVDTSYVPDTLDAIREHIARVTERGGFVPMEISDRELRERFAAAGVDPERIRVADYRDVELRALAHMVDDPTTPVFVLDSIPEKPMAPQPPRRPEDVVEIKREHPSMEKLLRSGILGAIGAAGMLGGYPRVREPLGGWNPALGRRHAEPELTPERVTKRAARRKANAARGRTKKGKR